MASYAIAHLKLDMLLKETGYKHTSDDRFRVFLTNSLEEAHPDTGTLFASWLSHEASEANYIKRDTPVMVIMGNPPYSVLSSNRGDWIQNLLQDYKQELRETKLNLDDDYIKFLRFGEYFISKNGGGILAFITNNTFVDGVTHRQIRKHLLQTFDKISIIDLHGNAKKKETAPDGSKDENVFDIQQGVSINIFVKNSYERKKALAKVFNLNLFGSRTSKYNFLFNNNLDSITFREISCKEPYYFFKYVESENLTEYEKGFLITELFKINSMGITSSRDNFIIDINKNELLKRILEFCDPLIDTNFIREKYFGNKKGDKYPKGDTRGWKLNLAREKIKNDNHQKYFQTISFRPFDNRFIYYSTEMVDWGREEVMHNLLEDSNFAFTCVRVGRDSNAHNYFVTDHITDKSISSSLDNANIFPLYIYPKNELQNERIPNFNYNILENISKYIALDFVSEKEENSKSFAPIDILDYIYAILHNPTYREKYKEFLKIDFPRVPYPKDKKTFWEFVKLGGKLRQIHLLESPVVEKFITTYPEEGENIVAKPKYADNKVWINDEQYFDKVPQVAWEFYIGGYQPAQKWLKDRKGRELNYEDIQHYQKIIVALTETDRIMKEIDKIEFE
jgi:predicted helicase